MRYRGHLFEVKLGPRAGPGGRLGRPDRGRGGRADPHVTVTRPRRPSRGLMIRLAPSVRDQNRVALQLQGYQRLPREGPVKLGLFAPDETTAVGASFVVAGDRSLSVELDIRRRPARPRPVPSPRPAASRSPRHWPWRPADARPDRRPPCPDAPARDGRLGGGLQILDLLQKTTFTVGRGALGVLEIRVVPSPTTGSCSTVRS